jgi:hypothetical protein
MESPMIVRKSLARVGLILLALAPLAAFADQNEFCNGYYRGYLEGYKRASGSIFEPSIPLCPLMPRKTARDPSDDSEHGYEVGYEQGREAGSKRFR